ncbi:FAD/NAD(P)-binding domain-containing protein [Thelephora ganbajun]|uniref:FAD/NAD(P)-binding domain-containing protein n=1 Tax=Thelephora ganbajun TaxID=370292 RepID=A0ACB6ZRS7_THEGA|nr:FAD/NAD(P)-binding domain-containing protein [Thelephora ganbajun]
MVSTSTLPEGLDYVAVANKWFDAFGPLVERGDATGVLDLLTEDSFWRDALALTWDLRTFDGPAKIKRFLDDRLKVVKFTNLKLGGPSLVDNSLVNVWIQSIFTFDIDGYGLGTGVLRLVPTSTGEWKGYTIYTSLSRLKDHPEQLGEHRNHLPNHGKWLEQRQHEAEFVDEEPYVLVVGGGHGGVHIAARLKHLGVPTLVVERNARIGDNWRNRYDILCLHDPVWHNQFPYIPFPSVWPTFTPSKKLGEWFEFYVSALELNVWTSSEVLLVEKDSQSNEWRVKVRRTGPNPTERVFRPVHVIFALGTEVTPHIPDFPGKEKFKGEMIHTSKFKSAKENAGKRVLVVGAGTSGHDIAWEHVNCGAAEVTIYQRNPTYIVSHKEAVAGITRGSYWYEEGGPPTHVVDLYTYSLPRLVSKSLLKAVTAKMAKADKDLHAGLEAKGFRTSLGDDDAGLIWLMWVRAGGFYLDVGASTMIVNGQIRVKSGPELQGFDETGALFDDGSKAEADVVVIATGYENVRESITKLCAPEISEKIKPIWGLDGEYELNSVWRDCGVDKMWIAFGNIGASRYHSSLVALQIKAMKEGIFNGERYSL